MPRKTPTKPKSKHRLRRSCAKPATAASKVVVAREFILSGKQGGLAILGLVDGKPCLRFFDELGHLLLGLGITKDGPSIMLGRGPRGPSLVLKVKSDGSAHVSLSNQEGSASVKLDVDAAGLPSLVLFDKRGKVRAGVGVDEDDDTYLYLFDRKGKSTFCLPD